MNGFIDLVLLLTALVLVFAAAYAKLNCKTWVQELSLYKDIQEEAIAADQHIIDFSHLSEKTISLRNFRNAKAYGCKVVIAEYFPWAMDQFRMSIEAKILYIFGAACFSILATFFANNASDRGFVNLISFGSLIFFVTKFLTVYFETEHHFEEYLFRIKHNSS